MKTLIQLVSGTLKPGIYRCDALDDPVSIQDPLAEKGWRDFYVDGRLVTDKQSLLDTLCGAMSFPGYVGSNWDALEEAIRDLAWARGTGYLITYDYPQIFAAYQPQDWQTFLSILRTAIAYWHAQDVPMFVLLCKTEEGLEEIPRL